MYREQRSPNRDDEGNNNPGSPSGDTKNFDPKLTAPYQNDDDFLERESKHSMSRYRERSNSAEREPSSRDVSKERRFEGRGRSPGRPCSPRPPPKVEDISPPGSNQHRSRSPHERVRSPSSRDRSPYGRRKSPPPPRDRSHSRTRSPPRSPSHYSRSRSPPFTRFPVEKNNASPKDISDEIQEEMRRQKRRAEEERRREERRKRHQRREENERRAAEERKRREE